MKFIIILLIASSLSCFANIDTLVIDFIDFEKYQQKINSLHSDSLVINITKNLYEISNPVDLTINENFKYLKINGNNSELKCSKVESESKKQVTGIFHITAHKNLSLFITNIKIKYNASDYGLLAGLNILSNNATVNLANITAIGASFCGIYIQNASGGTVINSICNYNKMGGLLINSSKNLIVENCEFSFNGSQTPVYGYGFALVNCFPPSENIIVRNNKAINNQRKGFDVHSGINILFEKNYVKGFEYAGIYAVSDGGGDRRAANITIRDNFIDGDTAHFKIHGIDIGSYGKNPDSCGYFIVENNHIINTDDIEGSCAISVLNPDSGVAISSISIKNNIIEYGSADKYSPSIYCRENSVLAKFILIENNKIYSNFNRFAIIISGVEEVVLKNNEIYNSKKSIIKRKRIKCLNVKNIIEIDNIIKTI